MTFIQTLKANLKEANREANETKENGFVFSFQFSQGKAAALQSVIDKYEHACGGCKDPHASFWKTVTESEEWEAWYKYNHGENLKFDVDECQTCGWISPEHWKAFISFITTQTMADMILKPNEEAVFCKLCNQDMISCGRIKVFGDETEPTIGGDPEPNTFRCCSLSCPDYNLIQFKS